MTTPMIMITTKSDSNNLQRQATKIYACNDDRALAIWLKPNNATRDQQF